jgi:hypothetical protein
LNKILIIKKIQLGESTFPIENQNSKLSFNFYCGNGGIKHKTILSLENSNLLDSLIESGQIDIKDLSQNDIDKLQNLEDKKRPSPIDFKYIILKSAIIIILQYLTFMNLEDIIVLLYMEFYK